MTVVTQGYHHDPKTIYVCNGAYKRPDSVIVLSMATRSDTACYMDREQAKQLIADLQAAIYRSYDSSLS